MTQKRYNYLPHPISEYGIYRAQPWDTTLDTLARKDQAAWNFSYLSCSSLLTKWYSIAAMPNNEDAKSAAALLRMHYHTINVVIDGVSVRHQVLHLPPKEFASWFSSVGGYSMLEGYGQGVPRVSTDTLKVFQHSLLTAAARLQAVELTQRPT